MSLDFMMATPENETPAKTIELSLSDVNELATIATRMNLGKISSMCDDYYADAVFAASDVPALILELESAKKALDPSFAYSKRLQTLIDDMIRLSRDAMSCGKGVETAAD